MKGTFKTSLAILGLSAASIAGTTTPAAACDQENTIAMVCLFAGNFAPRNWAFANGALLQIATNPALFSLVGTTYGGDGRTTFALPDLTDRVAVGAGHGPGLTSRTLGETGGENTHTLTINELPQHVHAVTGEATTTATLRAASANGNAKGPGGNSLAANNRDSDFQTAAPDVDLQAGSIVTADTDLAGTSTSAGSSQAHENRMPYLRMNYIIALQGLFPSRN